MTSDIQFDKITRNALNWSHYFESVLSDPKVEKDRISSAFGLIKDKAYGIIRDRLSHAIETSSMRGESEFSREPLKQPLLDAFLQDEMVRVQEDGTVYLNTVIAGDTADLMDGISAARGILETYNKSNHEATPEQKSNYWRNVVFPSYAGGGLEDINIDAEQGDVEESNDLWTRTMGLRFSFWQGIAPYWYFLEHGNRSLAFSGDTGGTPFPANRATNFVYKIEQELNRLMQLALSEIEQRESNIVDESMDDFIKDPENYEVFDILDEIYRDGRKYYVYITPTRRIGVALTTTYKRLSGR